MAEPPKRHRGSQLLHQKSQFAAEAERLRDEVSAARTALKKTKQNYRELEGQYEQLRAENALLRARLARARLNRIDNEPIYCPDCHYAFLVPTNIHALLRDEKNLLREALSAALVILEIHAYQFQAMRFPQVEQVKTALRLTRPEADDES